MKFYLESRLWNLFLEFHQSIRDAINTYINSIFPKTTSIYKTLYIFELPSKHLFEFEQLLARFVKTKNNGNCQAFIISEDAWDLQIWFKKNGRLEY